MNLAKKLHDSMIAAQETPFIFEDKHYTFGDIDIMILKTASFMQDIGVKFGDRVAIQMPKLIEFVYFHLANLTLGAITLPLNTEYSVQEVEYFLTDSESAFFVTYKDNYLRLKDMLDRLSITVITVDKPMEGTIFYQDEIVSYDPLRPDFVAKGGDVGMIGYTSGTTGRKRRYDNAR